MSLCQRPKDRSSVAEFVREKGVLFDKWCAANSVKNNVPPSVDSFGGLFSQRKFLTFLNEQKGTSVKQQYCLMSLFLLTMVSGLFKVAVLPELPIKGVDFILSNDLTGGKVVPVPEVVESSPTTPESDQLGQLLPSVFPACAVTRAQSKKHGLDLSDTIFVNDQVPEIAVIQSDSQLTDQPTDIMSQATREVVRNTLLPKKVIPLFPNVNLLSLVRKKLRKRKWLIC